MHLGDDAGRSGAIVLEQVDLRLPDEVTLRTDSASVEAVRSE